MQVDMNFLHGGHHVISVLKNHNITTIFSLCGGHITPILVAAKQAGITVIDVRDEAAAAFAADAYSRLSGTPGIVVVTAGPGLTNTITAVKNAQLAESPLIIISGAAATLLKGRGALQDIDQLTVMRPHVKWAKTINTVRDIVPTLEKAFYLSQSGMTGPVFIEIPIDILYHDSLITKMYLESFGKAQTISQKMMKWYVQRHLKNLFKDSHLIKTIRIEKNQIPVISSRKIKKITKILKKSERPLLLVGSSAVTLKNEALPLADAITRLGIPTYLSGMARGILGRRHPLQMRHRKKEALKEADAIILAGVPFDFRLNYGLSIKRTTTIISCHRSPKLLMMNRKPTIGMITDPAIFLKELSRRIEKPDDHWNDWISHLRARDNQREKEIEHLANEPAEFVNPLKLCQALEEVIDEKSIIIGDGGDFVATASYIIRPRTPLTWLDPGVFGALGCGAGFALAAKSVRPDHEVWVLYGDGAFGYSLIEFDTFIRHKLPIIAVIGNDAAWMQIAREQLEIFKDDVGVILRRSNYHIAVKGLGAEGFVIESNDEISSVLKEAKEIAANGKPVVVNALIDKTDFRKGSISI